MVGAGAVVLVPPEGAGVEEEVEAGRGFEAGCAGFGSGFGSVLGSGFGSGFGAGTEVEVFPDEVDIEEDDDDDDPFPEPPDAEPPLDLMFDP